MNRIDPGIVHTVRTVEDYVVLLRQVRAVSELSFWQLQERAGAGGLTLEPAVLAHALGPAAVTAPPDPAVVTALLYACGYPGDEIETWLDVHDRLTAVPDTTPVPGAHRVSGTPGHRRAPARLRRVFARAGAGVAVVAAVVTAAVVIVSGGSGDGEPSPDAQQPGQAPPAGTPHALAYPTTDPTPAATVSATPSRTASPATKSPAVPAGVARSGSVTLTDGQGVDLDTGATGATGIDLIAYGDGSGVRAGPADRHFAAHPAPTKPACTAAGYQKTLGDLRAGTTACVRTDRGAYGQITVTGTGPLVFSYVVWS